MTPADNQNGDEEPLPRGDVHRTTIREELGVTMSIVTELSQLSDCSPTDLQPLYYDVDPDKLDWVVEEADENKVSFRSNGFAVTAYGNGTLVFNPVGE